MFLDLVRLGLGQPGKRKPPVRKTSLTRQKKRANASPAPALNEPPSHFVDSPAQFLKFRFNILVVGFSVLSSDFFHSFFQLFADFVRNHESRDIYAPDFSYKTIAARL